MNCRHCGTQLEHLFLDLGTAPPSNAYLSSLNLCRSETYYPLRVYVCDHCWLVQTQDYAHATEYFSDDYAYFSSVSTGWLDHAARYVEMIRHRLELSSDSFVIEVASNDGYLLKNFVAAGIPCLGVEPTAGTAAAAEALGIPVKREFFTQEFANQLLVDGQQADLIIGNNVLAHVPDINDFTQGLKTALKVGGVTTLEFPHLLRLIEGVQFDTVYHEHFSYLSLGTVVQIFEGAGLTVFDVEELPTHGGSLRVYGTHAEVGRKQKSIVNVILALEVKQGLRDLEVYRGFQARADRIKNELLAFLLEQKQSGKTVAAYGAAAKGNTLLNYAGIKGDLITVVYDAAPSKQGRFMPGSRLPILSPDRLYKERPDWLLILPWNISREVMEQHGGIREWEGRFVTSIPHLTVLD